MFNEANMSDTNAARVVRRKVVDALTPHRNAREIVIDSCMSRVELNGQWTNCGNTRGHTGRCGRPDVEEPMRGEDCDVCSGKRTPSCDSHTTEQVEYVAGLRRRMNAFGESQYRYVLGVDPARPGSDHTVHATVELGADGQVKSMSVGKAVEFVESPGVHPVHGEHDGVAVDVEKRLAPPLRAGLDGKRELVDVVSEKITRAEAEGRVNERRASRKFDGHHCECGYVSSGTFFICKWCDESGLVRLPAFDPGQGFACLECHLVKCECPF
jgi:hypothetical protein